MTKIPSSLAGYIYDIIRSYFQSSISSFVLRIHINYFTGGIAGICSFDGRHLALMPHPERSIFTWQWPYTHGLVADGPKDGDRSPWMQMFYNAYEWCSRN